MLDQYIPLPLTWWMCSCVPCLNLLCRILLLLQTCFCWSTDLASSFLSTSCLELRPDISRCDVRAWLCIMPWFLVHRQKFLHFKLLPVTPSRWFPYFPSTLLCLLFYVHTNFLLVSVKIVDIYSCKCNRSGDTSLLGFVKGYSIQ
jgi:hypothetical protein